MEDVDEGELFELRSLPNHHHELLNERARHLAIDDHKFFQMVRDSLLEQGLKVTDGIRINTIHFVND